MICWVIVIVISSAAIPMARLGLGYPVLIFSIDIFARRTEENTSNSFIPGVVSSRGEQTLPLSVYRLRPSVLLQSTKAVRRSINRSV